MAENVPHQGEWKPSDDGWRNCDQCKEMFLNHQLDGLIAQAERTAEGNRLGLTYRGLMGASMRRLHAGHR